jgi:hypothetical protein
MKPMKKLAITFILSIFIFNCSTENTPDLSDNDSLIFGHFYGFCAGESCIETFKLTNKNLYEDTLDNYTGSPVNFEALDNGTFELVKDLINYFPEKLLSEKEGIIGCPDCSDGGGIFIEYSKNGVVKSWRIDQFKWNIPDYLHDFVDKVNEKIDLINI